MDFGNEGAGKPLGNEAAGELLGNEAAGKPLDHEAMGELLRDSLLLNPDFWAEDEDPSDDEEAASEAAAEAASDAANSPEGPDPFQMGMPMDMPMGMPNDLPVELGAPKPESRKPDRASLGEGRPMRSWRKPEDLYKEQKGRLPGKAETRKWAEGSRRAGSRNEGSKGSDRQGNVSRRENRKGSAWQDDASRRENRKGGAWQEDSSVNEVRSGSAWHDLGSLNEGRSSKAFQEDSKQGRDQTRDKTHDKARSREKAQSKLTPGKTSPIKFKLGDVGEISKDSKPIEGKMQMGFPATGWAMAGDVASRKMERQGLGGLAFDMRLGKSAGKPAFPDMGGKDMSGHRELPLANSKTNPNADEADTRRGKGKVENLWTRQSSKKSPAKSKD